MDQIQEIIVADNISYTYEDDTKALCDVSFYIGKGETVAFLGANGSGKSTLMLCLIGILQPQAGTIYYEGEKISYHKNGLLKLRSKVGLVFQEPDNQLILADIRQELAFGPNNLELDIKEVEKRVDKAIVDLDMRGFVEKPIHFLSGGQKKQVAIGDILTMNPEVIILDEPAAALDPKHTDMVNEQIHKFREQGFTVILSTHDVNQALMMSDRVFLFKDGKLCRCGKTEEVFLEKALLEECNLVQPDLIKIYLELKSRGLIKPDRMIPRTVEGLCSILLP